MSSLRDRIDSDELFFDSVIITHGYARHLRDYDVVIEVPAALPPEVPVGDSSGSYIKGEYRYRFSHCPEAHVRSSVDDEGWRCSWDDVFIDYRAWEAAGKPAGLVWGINHADAYPGLSYIANSELAASWAELFGHEMHEVAVETNRFVLRLVCHDLQVEQLAVGDPLTRTLTSLDGA